jgi:CRP/FNR family transcriptional regulator
MNAGVSNAVAGLSGDSVSGSAEVTDIRADAPVRTLLSGEILFRDGDLKTHLHKISAGVICVYQKRVARPPEVIEFAFPGDVLGLGYLEQQIYWARALAETRVECLPLSALDDVVQSDHRTKQRHAEALDREFAYRRNLAISANRKTATGRVAAFFLAVSRANRDEGRHPQIITDSLACGVVADWLGLDLSSLGRALVELEERGLIEPSDPRGLRLKHVGGLESLVDENVVDVEFSRAWSGAIGGELRTEA